MSKNGLPQDLLLPSERMFKEQAERPGSSSPEKIQPSNEGSINKIVYDLLRDNYKMADSTSFVKFGSVSISLGTFTNIVTFTMPQGTKGVLKLFGQGANTVAAFDSLTWQLSINSNPITDLGNFTAQLGSIMTPKPVTYRLKANDIVAIAALTSGTTYTAQALIEGWYWSL